MIELLRTLPLYVLREQVGPITLSGLFFTGVLLLAQLIDMSNTLLKAGVGGSLMLELLGIIIVTLMTFTVPMAVLLGLLIAVGRMTAENEILAMRVSGISMPRVFAPLVVTSVLIAVLLVGMNAVVIPRMFQRIQSILYEMQVHVLTNLRPGQFYDELGSKDMNMTLYFHERLNPGQGGGGALEMRDVNMKMRLRRADIVPEEGAKDSRIEFIVFSEKGIIEPNLENNGIELSLENGVWMPLSEEPSEQGVTTMMSFGRLETQLGGPEIDERNSASPEIIAMPALIEKLKNPPTVSREKPEGGLRRDWRNYFALRNELLRRLTLPFAVVAFTLIAIPLAIEIRPRAKSLSLLIAVGLMLIYYALMTLGSSISSSGASWPVAVLASLMPNVVIGAVGILLFWRASAR